MPDETSAAPADRAKRKIRQGSVISEQMDKTRVVVQERQILHPTWKRYVRRRKKFYVHDENNESHVGDVVRFMETRPLSKQKRWRLLEIVERAK
jgi:small subunit ribosomal protein S17